MYFGLFWDFVKRDAVVIPWARIYTTDAQYFTTRDSTKQLARFMDAWAE